MPERLIGPGRPAECSDTSRVTSGQNPDLSMLAHTVRTRGSISERATQVFLYRYKGLHVVGGSVTLGVI